MNVHFSSRAYYLKGAKTRCFVKETVQLQKMTHQSTPGSVMPFLHLHIFNKVESGRVFRQADRGESEHVVDERRPGFWRKGLVIFLEGLRQELPIFLVIVHTIITLKAINNDRVNTRDFIKLKDIKINMSFARQEVIFRMSEIRKNRFVTKSKLRYNIRNNYKKRDSLGNRERKVKQRFLISYLPAYK